jgi:hypothetical protein
VPWLILRALRLCPEDAKPSKAFGSGNLFAWLLFVSNTLVIIITTTALIQEPVESLPIFMLRSVGPMRSILSLLKILVICKNRIKLNDQIQDVLTKIPYPKVLGKEVKKYNSELQTSSKFIAAFVIFSFVYNIPTVAAGIFLVLQQTEQDSPLIQLWLPFKTVYNKTVVGNVFCKSFDHFIRFHTI